LWDGLWPIPQNLSGETPMNQHIGRYVLPLGSIIAIQERNKSGWRKLLFWRRSGYDATLTNGRTIHLTTEEKAKYEELSEWHAVTMQWYGMAKGLGLRG
jgi:hypothetical protein